MFLIISNSRANSLLCDSHLHHVDTLRSEFSTYIASYGLNELTIYTSDLICTIRVWYNNPYHTRMVIPCEYTRMVCTIRVWYVPYAYGINTRMVQNSTTKFDLC